MACGSLSAGSADFLGPDGAGTPSVEASQSAEISPVLTEAGPTQPDQQAGPCCRLLRPARQDWPLRRWGWGHDTVSPDPCFSVSCSPASQGDSVGTRQAVRRGGPAPPHPVGSSCVQCLIFSSNFLFSVLGLLALAAGLRGLAVKGSLGSSWGSALPPHALLGLVLGGLAVATVSLAGCLGALCESGCLLRSFGGAVLTLLVLEALAGALVVALWGPLQDSLEQSLHAAIARYRNDPDLSFLLDQVQLGLRCCGVTSYQDWWQNPYFSCSAPGVSACSLPASCCEGPRADGALGIITQCGSGVLCPDGAAVGCAVHPEGCGPALRRWLHGSIPTVGGWAVGIVLVQGAELWLATQLLRAITARKAPERPRPGLPRALQAVPATGHSEWGSGPPTGRAHGRSC
ncbi:tetraspanin-10 [Ctenodactylus gundi]